MRRAIHLDKECGTTHILDTYGERALGPVGHSQVQVVAAEGHGETKQRSALSAGSRHHLRAAAH